MSDKPVRVQMKRTKGWCKPENTVYVGRPGKWGNPFRVGGYFMIGDPARRRGPFGLIWCEADPAYADSRFTLIEDRATAVEFYRRLIAVSPPRDIGFLRGKNLACWCALDKPCHADVLLEIANQ